MAGRWFEMIIKEIRYIAICNRCAKKRVETEAKNMTEFREILRGTGWSIGSRTLCPECKSMMRREKYAENR